MSVPCAAFSAAFGSGSVPSSQPVMITLPLGSAAMPDGCCSPASPAASAHRTAPFPPEVVLVVMSPPAPELDPPAPELVGLQPAGSKHLVGLSSFLHALAITAFAPTANATSPIRPFIV